MNLKFDASTSFQPDYARTSFDEQGDLLHAQMAIENIGQYEADTPFYVGVVNVSEPTVSVSEVAGVSADGIPYYNLSELVPGESFSPEEITGYVDATFHNPQRVPFTYDLVFLIKTNDPPQFTSVPIVETYAGWTYDYDSDAIDPDEDPLTYSLLLGPEAISIDPSTGRLTWLPALADLGAHTIVIRAEDGRGGSAEQRYLLSVVEAPPNRPPYFTSVPVTEAEVSEHEAVPEELFDLSQWEVVDYEQPGSDPRSNWVLSDSNTTATQTLNGDPSILLSDVVLTDSRVEGTWRVSTSDDDDYVGFVFGYQDRDHFYLFDWKQYTSDGQSKGMKLRLFDADTPLERSDLRDGNWAQVLFENDMSYSDYTDYTFILETHPGKFAITVKQGDAVLESFTISDDTYLSGRFGFYNFSQKSVVYKGFQYHDLPRITYHYDADALDPDLDPVRYSLLEAPDGMQIDPTTGQVTWAPTVEQLEMTDAPAADPTLPVVPGFDVELYADVVNPAQMSFGQDGSIFVGSSGATPDAPVPIYRIGARGETVEPYGDQAIPDADTVVVDVTGIASGIAGAVLVGSMVSGTQGGQIWSVLPDGTIQSLFGPSTLIGNPISLSFDPSGRLVFLNQNTGELVAYEDGASQVLATHATSAARMAIYSQGWFFVGGADQVIRVYNSDGALVDDAYATNVGTLPSMDFGSGNYWGDNLYVVDYTNGELLRFDDAGDRTVVGTGFTSVHDIAFGPDGALYISEFETDRILRIAPNRETLGLAPNEHQVTIAASDGRGGADQQTFVVRVESTGNHPPVIVSEPVTTIVGNPPGVESTTYSGIEFPLGDLSFADEVVSYSRGSSVSGEWANPENALGTPPRAQSCSLGRGGNLVVEFVDNLLVDQDQASGGLDLYVFEVGGTVEWFRAEISKDLTNWIDLGIFKGQPTGIDIKPFVEPGDRFRYVRVSDVPPNQTGSPYAEADIDAIGAIGSVSPDSVYEYDVDAIDPDDDPITYSLTEYPDGMTIDPDSGLIEWAPPADLLTANQVTFSDGDFDPADWEMMTFTTGSGGTISTARQDSGGNPGAYQRVEISMDSAQGPLDLPALLQFYRNTGATYDPQVSGPVYSVDYSEDSILFYPLDGGYRHGQKTGPAIWQDGRLYVALFSQGTLADWTTLSWDMLTDDDFDLVVFEDLTLFDPTQHPDFSGDASPLEFGFFRKTEIPPGSPYLVRVDAGIDNWQVVVTPVSYTDVTVRADDGRGGYDLQPYTIETTRPASIQGVVFEDVDEDRLWDRTQDLLVSSTEGLLRLDGSNGLLLQRMPKGGGFAVGPHKQIYVQEENVINRYDSRTGEFIDVFAEVDVVLEAMTFGPDGNLYATRRIDDLRYDDVVHFDGETGEYLGVFASGGGLQTPWGLAFADNGDLYVASTHPAGNVIRYDGETGQYVETIEGWIGSAVDLATGPDGHLYVANWHHDGVRRIDTQAGIVLDDFRCRPGWRPFVCHGRCIWP